MRYDPAGVGLRQPIFDRAFREPGFSDARGFEMFGFAPLKIVGLTDIDTPGCGRVEYGVGPVHGR